MSAYYFFFYIFITEFLFYVEVFLISTSVAYWYYGKSEENGCWSGTGVLNRYHIGSLTFASMLIIVVKIIKFTCKRI